MACLSGAGLPRLSCKKTSKPFWILLQQEIMGWQWHQPDHMQIICTSLETDNHDSTSPLSFYRPDAFPAPNQQRQSTEGNSVIKITEINSLPFEMQ